MAGVDSNTSFMIPMSTANGKVDISDKGHTIGGSAITIDTTVTDPFGGNDGVGYFDSNQYLTVSASEHSRIMYYNNTTPDAWTLDFFIKGDSNSYFQDYVGFFHKLHSNNWTFGFGFKSDEESMEYWSHSYTHTYNVIRFSNDSLLDDEQWHHVCIVVLNNYFYMFVDSDLKIKRAWSVYYAYDDTVRIGQRYHYTDANYRRYWGKLWMSNYRLQHSNYFNIDENSLSIAVPQERYSSAPQKRYRNQSVIIT